MYRRFARYLVLSDSELPECEVVGDELHLYLTFIGENQEHREGLKPHLVDTILS